MKSILLDVDGVTADFIGGLERALNHTFSPEDLKEWDVLKKLEPSQREKALEALSGTSFWRNLPVKDGAKEGVRFLENMGYEITWVTSPWTSCEGWEAARRDWLDEHFGLGTQGHHYIPTSSKEKVVGDVFIDDKPENVKGWREAHPGKQAFIFDAPYNKSFYGAPRLTWGSIGSIL